MNKHELISAYDRLTLSEEFRERARARLTQEYGQLSESFPESAAEEQHAKSFTLAQPKKPKRGAVLGIASAAVVALGVLGAVALHDRGSSPLNEQTDEAAGNFAQTQETSETQEYTYPIRETSESREPVRPEEYPATEDTRFTHIHSFPSYFTNRTEYNGDILDIIPFDAAIDLPPEWSLSEPDGSVGGLAPVNIVDGTGETVAVMDYCTYEIVPEAVGQPNYYRMVYNQLMLGSMVSWDCEYTPVAQTEYSQNATCQIMSFDRGTGETSYSDGILAYNDELLCYVNISFTRDISDELQRDIAKSIRLSRNFNEIANRTENEAMSHWLNAYGALPEEVCVNAYSFARDAAVVISTPSRSGNGCEILIYRLYGNNLEKLYYSQSQGFDRHSVTNNGNSGELRLYSENDEQNEFFIYFEDNLKGREITDCPLDNYKVLSTEKAEWETQISALIFSALEDMERRENNSAPALFISAQGEQFAACTGANSWSAPDNADYVAPDALDYWENGLIAAELPHSIDEITLLLPEGAEIRSALLTDENGVEYTLSFSGDKVELLNLALPSVLTVTVNFTDGTAEYHIRRACDPSKTEAALTEPPPLCIEANGERLLTSMGKSTWTYNGMTTSASTYDNNPIVIPDSQWIDSVRVIIPQIEGARIQSVIQHLDGYGSGPCLVTGDVIDFPDGGRLGNRYTIIMEYPQGVCEYHFATEDVLTEPPHGYVRYGTGENTGELTMMYKADYSWEYSDRGVLTADEGFACGYPVDPLEMYQHVRATEPYTIASSEAAIPLFSGGEIVSVTAFTPDGTSDTLKFDKGNGRISMPEDSAFKIFIVKIAYDTEDYRGWCNYYFFME